MQDRDWATALIVFVVVVICIILGFASQKRLDELKVQCEEGSTTACIEYDNALRRLTERSDRQ